MLLKVVEERCRGELYFVLCVKRIKRKDYFKNGLFK